MQSGDREPLEGIAEEPPTEGSTAITTAAAFAQELLDYSQELEELYSASVSLDDAAPLPQTAAENVDMAAAEAAALGAETTAVSQEDVADTADVSAAEAAAMEAAETAAVSQEDVEDV